MFAFARVVVVTLGAVAGAVGAIGIQKWRVAKLKTMVAGLEQRLEIAEATSFPQYRENLLSIRKHYEEELREAREVAASKERSLRAWRDASEGRLEPTGAEARRYEEIIESQVREWEEYEELLAEVVGSTGSALEAIEKVEVRRGDRLDVTVEYDPAQLEHHDRLQ